MTPNSGFHAGGQESESVTRRVALNLIGAGAGAALLGAFGQRSLAARAQPAAGGDSPHVVMQRFQVGAGTPLDALKAQVEGLLLPLMAEGQGFMDSLVFDIISDQLVSVSWYSSRDGAEASFDVADAWQATDDAGQMLDYIDQVSFGSNLSYLKKVEDPATNQAAVTPLAGATETPFFDFDNPCSFCIQRYPVSLPGIVDRAEFSELLVNEAIARDEIAVCQLPG